MKILHHETNQIHFEKCLQGFKDILSSDDMYKEFDNYFNTNYSHNTKLWAACYRTEVGITTNNYIEAFHSVFKRVYLKGKVNKRMDNCLHALLKYARDRIFKRAKNISKDAYPRNIKDIVTRHQYADQMNTLIDHSGLNQWTITSESQADIVYSVEKVHESCPSSCRMICRECNICPHMFTCECVDHLTALNICKHIHRVNILTADKSVKLPNANAVELGPLEQFVAESEPDIQQESGKEGIHNELCNRLSLLNSLVSNPDFKKDDAKMKSLLEAVNNFIPDFSIPNDSGSLEPANKNQEKQLAFFTKSQKRKSKPRLGNPDNEEAVQFKRALMEDDSD